eukprot:1747216-Prymnesium_polylepis.1
MLGGPQCAGAAGTCAWANGRSSGAAAGRGAVSACAGRGRRAAGSGGRRGRNRPRPDPRASGGGVCCLLYTSPSPRDAHES